MRNNSSNALHLALAFDEKYLSPFYVLLTSIFVNNKNNTVVIHLIVTGITDFEKEKIEDFVKKNTGTIHFYKIDTNYINGLVLPNHVDSHFTGAIYYRLFFPFLVPSEVTRLLYIDVDTIVVGDLDNLMTLDLGGIPVGAVTDIDMPLRDDLGIYSLQEYFNSGVLLIDVPAWKAQNISENALNIISMQPEKIKGYPDQDALNMVLRSNWFKLPCTYNLMRLYVPNEVPKRRFKEFLKDQNIIHYNGTKPWFSNCEHRLRRVYQQYARLSPRSERTQIIKVLLSKEKQLSLVRSRMVEFYFDYPELVSVWRKLKSLLGR